MLKYPPAKMTDFQETLFGIVIEDPYRWLENIEDAGVKDWIAAQNELTDEYISRLPEKEKFKKRLIELLDSDDLKPSIKTAAGKLFYLKKKRGQFQYALYRSNADFTGETAIFDANGAGKLCSIDAFQPSPSGNLVAYLTSYSGSETGAITIYSLADKKTVEEDIKWSRYTQIVWNDDESGFYYSKVTEGGLNEKIYFHVIGVKEDVLVFGHDAPDSAIMNVYSSFDRKFVLIDYMVKWDRNEIFIKRMDGDDKFHKLLTGYEGVSSVRVKGGTAFIETNVGAPNKKIIAASLPDFENGETISLEDGPGVKVIVPEKDVALENFTLTKNYLLLNYTRDVSTRLQVYDAGGAFAYEIPLPDRGTAAVDSPDEEDRVYINFSSFFRPRELFEIDLATKIKKDIFRADVPVDHEKFRLDQVFYASKDGTKVPMYIARSAAGTVITGSAAGRHDAAPAMLTGYGGFNYSMLPGFSPLAVAWIESGGIFALANMRGGAEYGEEWHRAGKFEKKQNVFDDFIAAAEYLIRERYTSSSKLVIEGGSNGGLLVGAVMTQRPDLFAVAIPEVGVLDMLRYDLYTGGSAWAVEYGSAQKADQFAYLIRYSPLQNVKPGICYPATLIVTADHDDRVVPSHSYKFAAALQAAQACAKPVLIRVETQASHGYSPTDKQIAERADVLSFAASQVGIKLPDK